MAQTNHLSRNPTSVLQADDVYEESKINNIILYFKFVAKYGCLSNRINQSQSNASNTSPHKTNNIPKQRKTPKLTAIDCLTASSNSRAKLNDFTEMDAKAINNLELAESSAELRNLFSNPKMAGYSQTGYLPPIRWPIDETPRAKIPQTRGALNRGTTPTSDAKARTQRDPANRRLPTTNTERETMDSRPILRIRQPTAARTRTAGNIAAKLHPIRGRGD